MVVAYADNLGFMRYGLMRFNVMVARGRRRHQRCIGKLGSKLQRPDMKWSLNVEFCFFGRVGAVHMRRDELVVGGVGLQVVFDIARTLVVHDVPP